MCIRDRLKSVDCLFWWFVAAQRQQLLTCATFCFTGNTVYFRKIFPCGIRLLHHNLFLTQTFKTKANAVHSRRLGSVELSNTARSEQIASRMWCESICFSLDCDVNQTWPRPPKLVPSADYGCTCGLKLTKLRGPPCVSGAKAPTVFGYFYGHICTEK